MKARRKTRLGGGLSGEGRRARKHGIPAASRVMPILLSMILPGCTTRDALLESYQPGRGVIIVREKNNLEAQVYLDHKPTGKTTLEARLEPAAAGRHVVHLVRGKYRSVPDSIEFFLGASGIELVFEMSPAPFGSLRVASAPGNAVVSVNGLQRGTTPAEAGQALVLEEVPAGDYQVSLRYGNYHASQTVKVAAGVQAALSPGLALQQSALVEDFSNTSCDGCPEVSRRVEEVLRARGDSRILIKETHASFPSPNDPLHLAAKSAQSFLEAYYSPPFLPAVYCNGAKVDFGQNYTQVDSLLSWHLTRALAAPGLINLVLSSDGAGTGMVRVEAAGAPLSGAVLRIDLLQEEVEFAAPPGTNKQTVFRNVIRGSHGDARGVPVALGRGESVSVPFAFDIAAYPAPAGELFLIAYVQREADKAVLQANRSPL